MVEKCCGELLWGSVVEKCCREVLCFLYVFSLCVFCLCFLSVCFPSVCFLSVFFLFVCFLSVCFLSVCFLSAFSLSLSLSLGVFCLCFLSGFAFYRATKNDTFLSINVDIMWLWSGIAGQLFFTLLWAFGISGV